MNKNNNYALNKEWNQLIEKHPLRFEIWTLLELHTKLNVTQITKYVKQSKSTVARHLKSMESDGLVMSNTEEHPIKGRISPKVYQINPKFKKKKEKVKKVDSLEKIDNLRAFYRREINVYRKIDYNISQLLEYLNPLLDLLETHLGDIENTKKIYDKYLSYIDEPIFLYLDKKRAQKFMDLHSDYIFKLHKLAMEEELDSENAFVYFDMSLPIGALFELKRKMKRLMTNEEQLVNLENLLKNV